MINRIIEKIGIDKVLHYLLCYFIAVVSAAVYHLLKMDVWSVFAYCWLTSVVFGLAKEYLDEKRDESSEAYDWAADFLGASSGAVSVLLLLF